jgi:methionine synthase II (cobalamin-independent)
MDGANRARCGVAFPWPVLEKYSWGNSCYLLTLTQSCGCDTQTQDLSSLSFSEATEPFDPCDIWREVLSARSEKWQPNAAATLVGSLPHEDRQRALDLVFEQMVEIPVWPQLVPFSPEQMMVQFNEGLPGLVLRDNRTLFVTSDPGFEQELLEFYEEYLAAANGDLPLDESRFCLGEDTGRTFFAFLDRLDQQQLSPAAVKGQITGPFTLAAGLKDQKDRLALYDSRLRDVIVKNLALKAQWQVEHLSRFSLPVIIFIDEPALAGFGSSAFISVSAEDITTMLDEVVSHIHKAGGLAGTHVCANTDWSLFFNGSLDVINFDAYGYFERFALYRQDLVSFIERGGLVAWGIVPTLDVDNLKQENPESLVSRWRQQVERLVDNDLSLQTIFRQAIITPTCGCGTLPEALAERVISITREISEQIRQEFAA